MMELMSSMFNSPICEFIILPIFGALGVSIVSRYSGRETEKCDNWQERLNVWMSILISTFINYCVIFLLMAMAYIRGGTGY